jgi:hypothetical protein
MHNFYPEPGTYGLMASFENPDQLIAAAEKVRDAGYVKTDAYSPFPVEGLYEALGSKPTKLPILVLLGALAGGSGGFLMQWWMEVVNYPKNVGGRPTFSWPAFIPATYEMAILLGAFTAVIGMIVLNGLPQPYHPVFNVPQFRTASRDGFFLVVEAVDPKFEIEETKRFLETLSPLGVFEVER